MHGGGIGIVVNPYSRKNRNNPEGIKKLGYIIGDKGSCEATKSVADVERVAREFLHKKVEILGLSGGDGTNHITLSQFIRVYGDHPLPKIALLRGGTMNTIANSCGIKGTTDTILYNIVEKYHTGAPFLTTRRLIMRIEGDKYGFLFGNGAVAQFLAEYYATGKPSPLRAFTTLSRAIISAAQDGELARRVCRHRTMKIRVDGEKWEHEEYIAALAASIEDLGLGFKPFKRALERPGCFCALGVKSGALGTALALPGIRFSKVMNAEKFNDAAARHMIIETEEPMKYTIDGDIYEFGEHVEVAAGPELEMIIS